MITFLLPILLAAGWLINDSIATTENHRVNDILDKQYVECLEKNPKKYCSSLEDSIELIRDKRLSK